MPEPTRTLLPFGEGHDLAFWRGQIDKARAVRKTVTAWWDANLKAYAPSMTDDPDAYGAALNTNRDFTLVERKKADLFFQSPKVTVLPTPLFAGQEGLLATHETILNEQLGIESVHVKRLVHQVLFDVLCPAGTGWTVMGYDSATVDQPTIDPMTGAQTTVPVPIFEECYWRWLSPRQGLIPHDFRSTVWDDAPWLGYDVEIPVRVAKRNGWVPEDFTGAAPDAELHFDHGLTQSAGEAVCHASVIYYKSALYRDDQPHPKHLTYLVLIDGIETAAEHKDSPHQTIDPQGRLTPESLLGFPIHPLTIRTLSDACHVPSDCTISRPIVNELNTFRSQMVQFRDATTLRWMYNTDTLPPDAVAKMVRSPIGGMIGVPGDAFTGEGAIKELPQGSIPRENFTVNDYLDNDLARTHALDANQSGAATAGDTTATEAQLMQSNVNARLGLERGVVLDWYLQGVTKYSTLVQRFLPTERAAQIVGVQAAQAWDGWRKIVPASLAFTALPDSSVRTDLAWERKRAMDEYTFFANDPFINRGELLKQLLPRLNYSPTVLNLQPPEKGPEPTKPGLSLKGEDLNPLMPQFPILVEVLGQCGIKISPQAIQQAQAAAMNQLLLQQATAAEASAQEGGEADTAHGGKMAQMEGLSKHQTDMTGGMQGSGAPAPMGAGGLQ